MGDQFSRLKDVIVNLRDLKKIQDLEIQGALQNGGRDVKRLSRELIPNEVRSCQQPSSSNNCLNDARSASVLKRREQGQIKREENDAIMNHVQVQNRPAVQSRHSPHSRIDPSTTTRGNNDQNVVERSSSARKMSWENPSMSRDCGKRAFSQVDSLMAQVEIRRKRDPSQMSRQIERDGGNHGLSIAEATGLKFPIQRVQQENNEIPPTYRNTSYSFNGPINSQPSESWKYSNEIRSLSVLNFGGGSHHPLMHDRSAIYKAMDLARRESNSCPSSAGGSRTPSRDRNQVKRPTSQPKPSQKKQDNSECTDDQARRRSYPNLDILLSAAEMMPKNSAGREGSRPVSNNSTSDPSRGIENSRPLPTALPKKLNGSPARGLNGAGSLTEVGLVSADNSDQEQNKEINIIGLGKPVAFASDREVATEFSFAVMSEVEACAFKSTDRTGKRTNLRLGFPGLTCRHCRGESNIGGRLFPSSIKTMSDSNKTLMAMYAHLTKCPFFCNSKVAQLQILRLRHEEERRHKKYGSQKAFFTLIWQRIHGSVPPPRRNSTCNQKTSTGSADAEKEKMGPG